MSKILDISKPNRPEVKKYFQRQLESVNCNYTEIKTEEIKSIERLNKLIKKMADFIEVIDTDEHICDEMYEYCESYKNCTQCIINYIEEKFE